MKANLGSHFGSSFHYKELYLHKNTLAGTGKELDTMTLHERSSRLPCKWASTRMILSHSFAPIAVCADQFESL